MLPRPKAKPTQGEIIAFGEEIGEFTAANSPANPRRPA